MYLNVYINENYFQQLIIPNQCEHGFNKKFTHALLHLSETENFF